ncbi:hypothetical protein Dimus_001259, partial [Dionaea muscipula]
KFVNDELITAARRVKSTEMKPLQRILHFVVMKNLVPRFGRRDTTSFMDLTYMDYLITRRLVNLLRIMLRHMVYVISVPAYELPYGDWLTMVAMIDEVEIQKEEVHDEAEIHGESRSAEKFYDAEDEVQGSFDVVDEVPEVPAPVPEQQKEITTAGVDPLIPVGNISESDFAKFQAEFDRARVDRLQDELDRARAENARLQALLQQAKSQPKP